MAIIQFDAPTGVDAMPAKSKGASIETPKGLLYDKNHMWVKKNGALFIVGWTKTAVENAGDVSYLVLPKKGERLEAGKDFGSVETGKWVGRFASPVSGVVVESNDKVVRDPNILNEDPFGKGWLLKIRVKAAPKGLLDAKSYAKFAMTCEK